MFYVLTVQDFESQKNLQAEKRNNIQNKIDQLSSLVFWNL